MRNILRDPLRHTRVIQLMQELQKYNLLLSTMRENLENALCGLDGKNLVTEEIADLLSSIEENDIPDCWDSAAYPTLDNLEDFVRDLVSAEGNQQSTLYLTFYILFLRFSFYI